MSGLNDREMEDLLKILRYLALEGPSSLRTLSGEKVKPSSNRFLGCGLSRPYVRKILEKTITDKLDVIRVKKGEKGEQRQHSITLKGIKILLDCEVLSADSLKEREILKLAKNGLRNALKDDFVAIFIENDLLSELLTSTFFEAFSKLIPHTNFGYFSENDIKFRLTAAYYYRLNEFLMYLFEKLGRKQKHLKTSLRLNPQTGHVELPRKYLKQLGEKVERKTESETARRERVRWRKKSQVVARFLVKTFGYGNDRPEVWEKLNRLTAESRRRVEEEEFLQFLIIQFRFNLDSFVKAFSSEGKITTGKVQQRIS